MCGIVGYTGPREAKEILLQGLSRLEYRGYDSAGIAVHHRKSLKVEKRTGKLANLKAAVKDFPNGKLGIGHTRWATHGKVTNNNAHPHMSYDSKVTIVHNGIIDNHEELQKELKESGVTFNSETDSELVAHLIARNYISFASLGPVYPTIPHMFFSS